MEDSLPIDGPKSEKATFMVWNDTEESEAINASATSSLHITFVFFHNLHYYSEKSQQIKKKKKKNWRWEERVPHKNHPLPLHRSCYCVMYTYLEKDLPSLLATSLVQYRCHSWFCSVVVSLRSASPILLFLLLKRKENGRCFPKPAHTVRFHFREKKKLLFPLPPTVVMFYGLLTYHVFVHLFFKEFLLLFYFYFYVAKPL